MASGGRVYDFSFPTESSDFSWIEMSRTQKPDMKNQQIRKNRAKDQRQKRSGDRFRPLPLPEQQQQDHGRYEDQIWSEKSDSRSMNYPIECRNFHFGSYSEVDRDRKDNFIRITTVSIRI